MMKVAVIGANGRMGRAVSQAVREAHDLELVAGIDADDTIDTDSLAGADVAIEFTVPGQTLGNTLAALRAGSHVVVGTTGWQEADFDQVRAACDESGRHALIAPNFSLSAVLAMHCAALAAPWFTSVEVVERHHPDKVDAPSGTAIATAEGIAAARRAANCPPIPDATTSDPLGARGAQVEGISVHAMRVRGLVAHEEIMLGNPGETLTIQTDCLDRVSFMPGILLAVRRIADHPGLTVGLEGLLGLPDPTLPKER